MPDLTVISVADPAYAASDRVKICQRVLKKQGFNTHLEIDNHWRGWGSKINFNTGFVRKLDCKYVMFLDASDVIALAGPDKVMERYLELDHPWIYATERSVWPPSSFKPDDYPASDSPYRFVNSGGYIGEREYIVNRYRKWTDNWTASYDGYRSEQLWVAERFLENPGAIKLDTQCKIFLSVGGARGCKHTPDGRMYNPETGTYPLLIHFNGGNDISEHPGAKALWSKIL